MHHVAWNLWQAGASRFRTTTSPCPSLPGASAPPKADRPSRTGFYRDLPLCGRLVLTADG